MSKKITSKLSAILKKISAEIINHSWFYVTVILVLSYLLRLWRLGAIQEDIFDEVYFVKFAQNYLTGTTFFDIHPPLGKLIIALGLKIFSTPYFNGRIMETIFGTGVILMGYLAGKEIIGPKDIVKGKIVGFFTAIILALDGLILVYSRTGLMDIFMTFFILSGFYFCLRYARTLKLYELILAGIFLGLSASIKYIGGLLLLVYIAILIIKKAPILKEWYKWLIFFVLVPGLIYLSWFVFNFPLNSQFLTKVIEWHKQSLNYNITLKDTHPYGSKWWTWFLMLRPIWLYFKDNNGKYVGVDGMGNPISWWSSLVVVPLLIYQSARKDKIAQIIISGFLIFLLFWAIFSRVLFYYHAMPSFAFLSIGIAYLLTNLLSSKFGKIFVFVYFVGLFVLFIYFLPIWVGIPISSSDFYHKMWLKSWI